MKRLLVALAFLALHQAAPAAEMPQLTGRDFVRTFPYSMVGQLLFTSGAQDYSGSGTVIRPSSVITAGHNLYDFQSGWSTDLLFRRGLYGRASLSQQYATRKYILGGYRENVARFGTEDVRAFANDSGALRFARPVANGAAAGWSTDRTLLTAGTYTIGLGYGGEPHSGDELLFSSRRRPSIGRSARFSKIPQSASSPA